MAIYGRIKIHEESVLQNYKGGFKLLNTIKKKHGYKQNKEENRFLINIINKAFSVYLYDLNNTFLTVNEEFIKISDFVSKNRILGKSPLEIFPETGETFLQNNMSVISMKATKIIEEEIILRNKIHQQFITIKSPIYDEESNIIGVFGCSILLGTHSLSHSLQEIAKLGVLNPSWIANEKNKTHSIYMKQIFSKRERECLHHLVRGKTIKGIANSINLSPRTVEEYIENIKNKIGVRYRSELIENVIDSMGVSF